MTLPALKEPTRHFFVVWAKEIQFYKLHSNIIL